MIYPELIAVSEWQTPRQSDADMGGGEHPSLPTFTRGRLNGAPRQSASLRAVITGRNVCSEPVMETAHVFALR